MHAVRHVRTVLPIGTTNQDKEYDTMSESTRAMLTEQLKATRETIEAFAAQIESGEYGNEWTVTDEDGNSTDVLADDEDDALYHGRLSLNVGEDAELEAEHRPMDEPTVDETPISEYPLEVVDQRGREFAVVISTGGPHVEVIADGGQSARLAGYWSGEQVYLHGDVFDTFLDYFIDRDDV